MPQRAAPPDPRTVAADSMYPAIEAFVERASDEELDRHFSALRAALTALKGARATQGKKVERAISRTEELIHFLIAIRAKLETSKRKPSK